MKPSDNLNLFASEEMDEFIDPENPTPLIDRWIVPPFSVLDARQGYWQARKREWLELGTRGEEGRDGEGRTWGQDLMKGENTKFGKCLDDGSWQREYAYNSRAQINASGTSVFDPVLCEIIYQWFCPPDGSILDPFAGGSSRGIVAEVLGFDYTGIELRLEQVLANEEQAEAIGVKPTWLCGDSSDIDSMLPEAPIFDLLFTCPPYYDLEIYSESEKDGSAFETYESFIAWYHDLFFYACERVKDNRFIVVVVGEVRDKKTGIYRNFVRHTIEIFCSFGLNYYNEMILVTSVGSLPVRVGKQFASGRKIGKTHQNVLVFYKGDPRRIKEVFPNEVERADLT